MLSRLLGRRAPNDKNVNSGTLMAPDIENALKRLDPAALSKATSAEELARLKLAEEVVQLAACGGPAARRAAR